MGLAAESAADLGRRDAQLRRIHAEKLSAMIAVDEMALRADPHLALAIRSDIGEAGMRLDIALMGLLGLEGALDDDIGLLEALFDIAMAEFRALGDIGGLRRLGLDTFSKHVGVQHRR